VAVAIDRAGGSGVVARLDSGLSTQLGRQWKEGTDLSMGQWQKLALARALMRQTPLLQLFDEPTASLDAGTEHALFERLAHASTEDATRERGAVTVLVSHRFSTVRAADRILVIDDGKLVENGNHAELVRAGGLYAELYEIQAAAYR
jgi:ATP-binding cassette subfamily B protein